MPDRKERDHADRDPFIEPAVNVPVYCDNMAFMEIVGPNAHFALYVRQRTADGMAVDKIINLRLIMPLENVVPASVRVLNEVDHHVRKIAAGDQPAERGPLRTAVSH